MTVSRHELWTVLQDISSRMGPYYRDRLLETIQDVGMQGRPLGMLLHACDLSPADLTPRAITACVPYYTEAVFRERMLDLAEHDFLEQTGEDSFQLSERGSEAGFRLYDAVYSTLAALNPLSEVDLRQMADLLNQIADACRHQDAVRDLSCVVAGGYVPEKDTPGAASLVQIERAIGLLTHFRCDCHRTAWQPLGVSGAVWEPFTHLWRGEADSLASLVARIGKESMGRGHTPDDYARFVEDMIARGWVEHQDGEDLLTVTASGRSVRDEAERLTDDRFYAPWECLEEEAMDQLFGLAIQLQERLNPREPSP